MPANLTITRPSFTDTDTLRAPQFNAITILSATIPDATGSTEGVIRLAGDLTGSAASPQLANTGANAGTYGDTVLQIVQLTIDAKGRITAASNRTLGTAYGKTLIEAADAGAARTVLELGGTTFLDAIYLAVMQRQYPVGEMLITRRAGNPSAWLGFGTWAAYGAGKALVGLDAADTDFDALDKTGGAKTHTLAATEMPSHKHLSSPPAATTNTAGAHSHTTDKGGSGGWSGNNANQRFQVSWDPSVGSVPTSTDGGHTHTLTITPFDTGTTGGGSAHNNLQPYITVYMWRRTA
jgi:microcystin-dependent protein